MESSIENGNDRHNDADDNVFALLCDRTLTACKLDSFPDGTFSAQGDHWLELAIAWEKLLHGGSVGIFNDALHRIMWGLPFGRVVPEYEDIVHIVGNELLRDGEAFAAWDDYAAFETAIAIMGDEMDPRISDDIEYRYSIEHYRYLSDKMLLKVRYSKSKYVSEADCYRKACLDYEEAIKIIIPIAATWDENYWYDENHIYDEIANIYGIDYRDDFLEYGRLLQLVIGSDDDEYGIQEAWFATNIDRLPMTLAEVIWPLDTKEKIMHLFYVAAKAAEALVGFEKEIEDRKKRILHPIGVFEYKSLFNGWLYRWVGEHYGEVKCDPQYREEIKRMLFDVAICAGT